MVSSVPQVFAQITIGAPAQQISVEITIEPEGDAHVVHLVKKSNAVIQVDTISGTVQNLNVKDVNGDDIQFAIIGDNIGVSIFPTIENIVVEYDLNNVLSVKKDVWVWAYNYPVDTTFYFPDEVDLVFSNRRPVYIGEVEGMRCHGCTTKLQFAVAEPIIFNEVKWEGQKFPVFIRTVAEINSFNFDQPTKSISFEINNGNQFVTLIIPLELLWNPYEVYLNNEKILKHEFAQNSTHVWLNFSPNTAGMVEIIGTSVVPEFPILIPLVVGIAMVLGFQLKNKFNLC